MRQSSCRCVAQENDIAIAKVIKREIVSWERGDNPTIYTDNEYLVCEYHRDEQEHLNNLARREIGISSRKDIKEIINLDNNIIYL